MENETGEQPPKISEAWAKYLITVLAVIAVILYRLCKIELQWTEVVLFGVAIVPWLATFTQSFKLGKDGFEAVFRELEKAKQEIKEDVKKEADKIGAETTEKINEVKQSSEINQSINTFGTGGRSVSTIKEYKEKLIEEASDPTDPQKGKWGGSSVDSASHRRLSARVEEIPNNSYFRRVILQVESTDPANFPLTHPVIFHLHPTFARPIIEVSPSDNIAKITLVAYGAFTVGAETDGGVTKLELDMAKEFEENKDPFFTR